MPKIRVLHVITRLPIGGAERLLVSTLKLLDPASFESVVCCIQDRGELGDEVEAIGVPLIVLGRRRSGGFDRGAIPALAEVMRTQAVDVVHTHLYHANLYGRLAALRLGLPVFSSVHNTYTHPKWHRRLLNHWLARCTTRIIAVSDDIRRDILRYDRIPASRVVVLANGIDPVRVDTPLTRDEACKQLGVAPDVVLLGTVGRLEEQKGHIHLLRALHILLSECEEHPVRLMLVIVGEGRQRAALERAAAELGLGSHVLFAGARHDVAEILRALDIFVMPSLWEGLSLAMLEAMAARLPVIISDVSGVRQVMGEDGGTDACGVIVPPGDPPALAAAIRRLAGDPAARSAIGRRARERVLAHYSAQAMIETLQGYYRDACRGRIMRH